MVKSLEPNSPKAILDVPTRWESTYDMLLRLRRLRKVCIDLSETYKELCMNNTEWNMIDNAVRLKLLIYSLHFIYLFLFIKFYLNKKI